MFRLVMGTPVFRAVMRPFVDSFIRPVVRPVTRFMVGAIAIPIFRFILKRIFRLQELDDELEKDLEQWFRGSLLLLAATANMEHAVFGLDHKFDSLTIFLRLLLAIGVVEAMPDQELFAVIHPGPPKLKPGRSMLRQAWKLRWPIFRGVICQHLNRSSPVLAIMAAIFPGMVGWVCFGLALLQYLIIGLVTSRDRAMDVLSEFDRAVAKRRRELIEEFDLSEEDRIESAARSQSTAEAEEREQALVDEEVEEANAEVPQLEEESASTAVPEQSAEKSPDAAGEESQPTSAK